MKVARIAYVNTDPFFYDWPHEKFPVTTGFPRQLAQAAQDGEISAGPLPLVECWNLEDRFEPLGFWGIAAKEEARSVLLLSHKPISEMKGAVIGVTRESSTSVALLDVIFRLRYQFEVKLMRGMQANDDAWLVIGDQALRMWDKGKLPQWEYVTDLGQEWFDWQAHPFVFARWMVRKDLNPSIKAELFKVLSLSLYKGMASFKDIGVRQSQHLLIPSDKIAFYLNGMTFDLGPEEERSMELFRALVYGRTGVGVAAL